MKSYAVFCLIFISIQATQSFPKPINKILLEKIEKIRQQMPCGINGGPSLVPFRKEFVDLTYEESTIIRVDGFLEDIQVDNLNKFVVDHLDFSLLHLKLDFSFTLPDMALKGFYNVTGQFVDKMQLWGNGPFTVELNDLRLSGSLRLRIWNGFLDMTELQVVLSLKSLSSDISGILGSEETSAFFNRLIGDLIPQMLDTYSDDVGEMISEFLTPIANKYLHELTLSDLIGAGNGGDKPCTV